MSPRTKAQRKNKMKITYTVLHTELKTINYNNLNPKKNPKKSMNPKINYNNNLLKL